MMVVMINTNTALTQHQRVMRRIARFIDTNRVATDSPLKLRKSEDQFLGSLKPSQSLKRSMALAIALGVIG